MMWVPCQWNELLSEVVNFSLLQEFRHSWMITRWGFFRIMWFWLDALGKLKNIVLDIFKVQTLKFMILGSDNGNGCESWIIKKAEHRRINTFELWCWRRLLRVRWTARRSNQSILKEISPEYSLEGLMLKLKLQYFGHLMRRTDSLEKTKDDAGKD